MDVLSELIGESRAIETLRREIRRLLAGHASRRLPAVLIHGETGTGKGLVAQILHRGGPRRDAQFVDINCAAIPETLLEAELFGFERGAFTDARHAKPGLFQLAHRGTIFLDEVGLLPEALQGKLLSVLEERLVRRLGGTRAEAVDVSVIAASNIDLRAAVRERRFREDLYHRLAVLTVTLPPLRERGWDVILLAQRFLTRACQDYQLPPKRLSPDAERRLLAYRWPGNVRELANVMERAALLGESEVVTADTLGLDEAIIAEDEAAGAPGRAAPVSADEAAREHLREALEATGWNISRTAARLGLTRNTVRARIDRFGLRRAEEAPPAVKRAPRAPAAATPRSSEAPSTPSAPSRPAPPATIAWERRPVTFVRVTFVLARDELVDTSRELEVIVEKIRTFGGRVEDIGQTGFDASFGVEPLEDAAHHAASAALAIVNAAGAGETSSVPVRLAMHTASVTVGRVSGVAEVERGDKRQVSDVLDALVPGADPGGVVVSAATSSLLERRFALAPAAGGTTGLRSMRLLGRGGRRFGLPGGAERFLDRRHEVELLDARWVAAGRGSGQIVGIMGEPGVGKSRLLWEFLRTRPGDVLVLEAAAVAMGTPAPYRTIIELLRAHLGIQPGAAADTIGDRVARHVQDLDPAFAPIVPALQSLLGATPTDPRWSELDPFQRRQRTLDAVKALLLRESRRRPLLLALEDVHWLDSESQALLDALADGVPTARLLLVVTYRPEYRHGWAGRTYYTQIRVDPLEQEWAEQLVRDLVGEHPSGRSLPARLVEWTAGNPLFLEETVRSLEETGALVGERRAYRLAAAIDELEVPSTIEEVLAARMERLPDAERQLLQTAAVVGRDVPLGLLAAVTDLPEDALRHSLPALRDAEFLHEKTVYPQPEYTFKHPLTHAVAYGRLPEVRRRAVHARAFEAAERLLAGRLDEHADTLAHHAVEGHLWRQAVDYARRAAERAFQRFANHEAAAHLEHAITACARLPETPDTIAEAIELRFALRNALTPLGESARTLERVREARQLAERLGDDRRLGRALAFETNALYLLADFTAALESGRRALDVSARLGDFALEVAARMYLGRTHVALGRYDDAGAVLAPVVTALSGDRALERLGLPVLPAVFARSHLVSALVEQGRFDDAERHAAQALSLAETVDHPDTLFWAWHTVGLMRLARGAPDATDPLDRAREICRDHEIPVYAPFASSAVALAQARAGRAGEVVPTLRAAVENARSRRQVESLILQLLRLGEACALAGSDTAARAAAHEALELARRQGARRMEGYALRLSAEVCPSAPEAALTYEQALALAERLGMRPLAARCHLGLGILFARHRERDRAKEHLTLAASAFAEMAMPYWGIRAEEALEALG